MTEVEVQKRRNSPAGLPAWSLCLFAVVTPACLATDPTPISIESAAPQTDPSPPSFRLHVQGHGFGLIGLSFNMGEGEGTAIAALRLEIMSRTGLRPAEITETQTTLKSSTELVVEVGLVNRLPAGVYGVRLFDNPTATTPVALLENAFQIGAELAVQDTGPRDAGHTDANRRDDAAPTPDGSVVLPFDGSTLEDGGAPPISDATAIQDALFPDATRDASISPDAAPTFPDASAPDAQAPDAAAPLDAGPPPFAGAYQFRQRVWVQGNPGASIAAGVTFRLPIPHATLVRNGRSRSDGADLAVYLGNNRLAHQFEDALKLGQDDLSLIVRLPVAVPAGGAPLGLMLYYGDPNATLLTTDAVFEFAERFSSPLAPSWSDYWEQRCVDRVEGGAGTLGSWCTADSGDDPTRKSLSTPRIPTLQNAGPANEIYELSLYVGGLMVEGESDLLYLADAPDTQAWSASVTLPPSTFVEHAPDAWLTFTELGGAVRREPGWRFLSNQPFVRARARFRPAHDQPSVHLRYVSANATRAPGTGVGVDDLTIRRAAQPELRVALEPAFETR